MAFLLPHLLSGRAQAEPERPAILTQNTVLTYGDLDRLSSQLAGTFAERGIGRHERVALCLPKEPAAYIALFAAMKVGGCYVPIDVGSPLERLLYTLENCAVSALVLDAEVLPSLPAGRLPPSLRLIVTTGEAPIDREGIEGLPEILSWDEALASAPLTTECPAIENDLAYILYTSGSTGRPKGVMLSHRNALTFIEWAVPALGFCADDRVAGVADLHFDLSTLDTFGTIAAGGTLLPLPPRALLRPAEATRWMAEQRISVWYSTPSTLILLLTRGALAERELPDLRLVLFAGESFPVKYLRRLSTAMPRAALYNLYGPTETNVCTWFQVEAVPEDEGDSLPIGRACANTEIAVVDGEGDEVAAGTEGEIWVRGPSVMRGYWGNPERTRDTLIRRPGVFAWDEPWYRTGDFAVRREDGNLLFRGRRDDMVKVRGYRVEIGEVERALYTHPDVSEAAVVSAAAQDYGSQLIAFVVPANGENLSGLALKRYLHERLPAYMVPADLRCLTELPKTPSGKVDRARLARDLR
jgi:amino acid adenylation domain-containing protein